MLAVLILGFLLMVLGFCINRQLAWAAERHECGGLAEQVRPAWGKEDIDSSNPNP